jgi:hypothetical protein
MLSTLLTLTGGSKMAKDIAIELVLMEDERCGDELYVLDWEFDSANDKILYFKLFPLREWLNGYRSHPEYIAKKSDFILHERDTSGYISTSNRLNFNLDNGKFYDVYGRAYIRSQNNTDLRDLKTQFTHVSTVKRLGEVGVMKRMKKGKDLKA